jgi:hypothetical protein
MNYLYTAATIGTGTVYPSGTHEITPDVFCWVFFGGGRFGVAQSLVFCVMLCKSLFVLYLLAILLYIHHCTTSDYPFGIFKLFFQ